MTAEGLREGKPVCWSQLLRTIQRPTLAYTQRQSVCAVQIKLHIQHCTLES